jgi:hypothetical protein
VSEKDRHTHTHNQNDKQKDRQNTKTERQKKEADRKIDTDIYGSDITILKQPKSHRYRQMGKYQADSRTKIPKYRQRDIVIETDR